MLRLRPVRRNADGPRQARRTAVRKKGQTLVEKETDIIEELKTNPWYRRAFAIQLTGGAFIIALYEWQASPGAACLSLDILGAECLEYVIDGWTKWAIIAVGAPPASVFIVDAAQPVIERGKTLMGILFKPVRNKYFAQGEAHGRAEGEARTLRAASEWYARMEQARREGRDFNEPPPWETRNGKAD